MELIKELNNKKAKLVLILVLVEVALGDVKLGVFIYSKDGLNPCFSGSCSWRKNHRNCNYISCGRLNPYFSGSCSWSNRVKIWIS